MEILQFEFMRNALYAALLASLACGIIGTYVVVKRLVSISGGIAHTAFGGIGLGYLLGIDPLTAVLPFSVLSAVGIGLMNKKSSFTEDTSIGIFWSFGMALGVVFIGLASGYAPDLFGYLFGNILAVTRTDILLMIILDVAVISTAFLFFRQLEAVSFDEEFTKVRNLSVNFLYFLLLILIAVTVVILIRIVGIILVIALLSIPAAIARQFAAGLKKMMLLAVIFGMILTVSGLFISYILNIASGAAIILLSVTVLGILQGARYFTHKKNRERKP